jgi:hypothetical protein
MLWPAPWRSEAILGPLASRAGLRFLTRLDAAWLGVLLCYVAVFGGILVYSNFLPYTFDNNESFSAFWHARNMYEYGIANSSGLADESFSYEAAAHPYVYTHAGASPRLFAYVLYALGIRTIQLQIAVTVFTVGLLAFWFAYRFLADISTRLYAVVACLLLMTDYIMFTQWHVGTFHVWKAFLLFGGLYLAQRIACRKQSWPLITVYAFHVYLFYYETVFNVYVAAAVLPYFVFSTRDYRYAVKLGLAQFAGALTAAAILLGQLVIQFGWDVVRADIYYTFIGRNFATDVPAFLEAAKAFYADHNIVFWLNVSDAGPYRNLGWALRILFQDHSVHTPPWSLVVLTFAAAELVRRLRVACAASSMPCRLNRFFDRIDWELVAKRATMSTPLMLVALGVAVFFVLAKLYILAKHPELAAGLAPASLLWIFDLWPIPVGVAVLIAGVRVFRRLRNNIDWRLALKNATVPAGFVLAALIAAIFYLLIRHPEAGASLAPRARFRILDLWPILVGGGILIAGVGVVRHLWMALPSSKASRLSKFLHSIEWELVAAPFILAALGAVVFYVLASHPEVGAGLAPQSPLWIFDLWPVVIVGGILVVGAVFFFAPLTRFRHLSRILGASAFVAAALVFLLVQPNLYTPNLESVWRAALVGLADYTTGAALLVTAMLLLAGWYACGSSAPLARRGGPDRLLLAFAALLLAYLPVYFVFTGYVFTGYFVRYLSLTVFLNDLLVAFGLVAMIDCVRGLYGSFKQSTSWRRIGYGGGAAVTATGLVAVVVYWGGLQAFLFRRLPPDEISFFPILSKPPFCGSTIAASLYGGTVAYFNKKWAYFDGYSALAEGNVTLGPNGYRVKRDSPYVWFADREVNPAYNKPEYFMTKTSQYFDIVLGKGPAYLTDEQTGRRSRVGDVPLIRAIREGRTSYLHPVEVARDPSPLDRWSIVRLDWDFPPFLRPLEAGKFVNLHASSNSDGTRIQVDYRYAHQEGVPEMGTRIALLAHSRCGGTDYDVSVAPSAADGREFMLPASFAGMVYAEVQPATATKVGPTYKSDVLEIGSADTCLDRSTTSK